MSEGEDGVVIVDGLPENLVFHEDFGDPETLLNSRDWIRDALEDKGAEFLGGGTGMGQADIDILLEGHEYNVSIRPIIRKP